MSQPQLCPNHEWVESSLEDGQPVYLLTFAVSDVPDLEAHPRSALGLRWERDANNNLGLLADFGQGLQVLFNQPPVPAVRQALLEAEKLWICGLRSPQSAPDHIACATELSLPQVPAT